MECAWVFRIPSLKLHILYNTERNNAFGCPNHRLLLSQPASSSNKQNGKRANYISGNGQKLFKVKVDLITFKHKLWNNNNNSGNTDV